MVEVIVLAEGQTEEQFIKRVVAPVLRPLRVFVKPQLLNTSPNAQGGAVTFDRLQWNARNTLKGHPDAILTTFLDLYALDTGFPAFAEAKSKTNVHERVACLETALHQQIIQGAGCRPERFIPHIQPYEFEGLLFADVEALCAIEPEWHAFCERLARIREGFATPEHINDGYASKPSQRLANLLRPQYRKTRHGPLAAERITLAVMETQCGHFRGWMDTLRAACPGHHKAVS
ncbi:MAG: DUF4276 family protein [Magnetococcales bacterium]|nr:DUF4276 family protein [Magnetococcales bacterium]